VAASTGGTTPKTCSACQRCCCKQCRCPIAKKTASLGGLAATVQPSCTALETGSAVGCDDVAYLILAYVVCTVSTCVLGVLYRHVLRLCHYRERERDCVASLWDSIPDTVGLRRFRLAVCVAIAFKVYMISLHQLA